VVPGCVVVTLAGLLTACGPHATQARASGVTYIPATGGSVAVGIDQAPTGCNPNTASGNTLADHLVLSAVLPSAFAVDNLGTAHYDPALIDQAELQSTTPETVVYTINPRAVWSDGVPIGAADFIYAWQHQRSVPPGTTGDADVASTAGYDDIASMTPANKGRTLTVVFSTAYADWQGLFNDLLPAHVLARVGWSPGCTTVDPRVDLSGGPYEIASVAHDAITLVKNPRWWGQEPKLSRIVIKVATGPEQLAHWLYEGTVDVSAPTYFDQSFLEAVSAMPYVKSVVDVSATFLQLEFSTIGLATLDPLVRAGIAYAIDRQSLIDRVAGWADNSIAPATSHLYSQQQTAAYPTSPAPLPVNATTTSTTLPATGAITPQAFPTRADPASSDRELVAAGYERNASGDWVDAAGRPLDLRLAVDGGDGWAVQTADLVAAQLEHEGFAVTTITERDATAAGFDLVEGKVDLALIPLHTSPYASRTSAWYTPNLALPGAAGAEDWSGYASVKVDNLFDQAASQLDPVTAQPLYNKIDQSLWADMVALPLFAEPSALAWSDFTTRVAADPYAPGLLSTIFDWARLVSEPATYNGTPTLPSS